MAGRLLLVNNKMPELVQTQLLAPCSSKAARHIRLADVGSLILLNATCENNRTVVCCEDASQPTNAAHPPATQNSLSRPISMTRRDLGNPKHDLPFEPCLGPKARVQVRNTNAPTPRYVSTREWPFPFRSEVKVTCVRGKMRGVAI